MKIFIFLSFIFSFCMYATTPILNHYNNDYNTNIEFIYDSYDLSDFRDGNSIKEISVSIGFNSDNIIYGFGLSKEIIGDSINEEKDIYHWYNSFGFSSKISKNFFLLMSMNFDVNTSTGLDLSADLGLSGIIFEFTDSHRLEYFIIYQSLFGKITELGLYDKIVKAGIQIPAYYLNIGISYNYYIETDRRDYILYFNINNLIESSFK